MLLVINKEVSSAEKKIEIVSFYCFIWFGKKKKNLKNIYIVDQLYLYWSIIHAQFMWKYWRNFRIFHSSSPVLIIIYEFEFKHVQIWDKYVTQNENNL